MRVWTVGILSGACLAALACGRTAKQGSRPVPEGGQGGSNEVAVAGQVGVDDPFVNGGVATGGTSFSTGGKPEVICQKDERRCIGLGLYGCNSAGTDFELLADCANVGFCDAKAADGPKCVQIVCMPGSSFCSGTKLITCNELGQYVQTDDPVACPEPPAPEPICDPDSARCRDGLLEVCIDQGFAYSAAHPCLNGWHCTDFDNHAECISNACAAGASACVGNQVGSCADDGMSLSKVTLDCRAQSKVCTLAGECSAAVVDSLGPQANLLQNVSNWVELSAMDVHSGRLVTQLAAHLALKLGGTINWLIYEWKNGKYELLLDDATQVGAGDATFSSHALALPLKAGTRYLVGLSVTAKGSFYRLATFESRKLSFANMQGCTGYDGPDYHQLPSDLGFNDYETELSITTALPP